MRIVGFCGLARAGKDSAARYLIRDRRYVRIALADPIKRIAQELWGWEREVLWGDDARKEQVDPRYGCSPRRACQLIGTEMARSLDPDVWVRTMIRTARRALSGGVIYDPQFGLVKAYDERAPIYDGVVVPDARFPNELAAITSAGGHAVWIERPEAGLQGSAAQHVSEKSISAKDCDFTIFNDGSLESLWDRVAQFVDGVEALRLQAAQ